MNNITFVSISFGATILVGLVASRLAPHLGLMDIPGGRRQHKGPIPRVGGLALMTSLLLVIAILRPVGSYTKLELAVVALIATLGFLDDRLDLRARWKAALGLAIAITLAAGAVYRLLPSLGHYHILGIPFPPYPWVAFLLLVALFWCIPHGFNLIDGANGLATGYALVVFFSLWGTGFSHPFIVGGLLAILLLNWPKARLFLGDCGSLSIGLLLAISAQKALAMPDPNRLMWLFAYPIIDVTTVVLIRKRNGNPISIGDRNHLHYQMIDRWPGLKPFAVPILLGLAALCASKIYVAGWWNGLPVAGLLGLLSLSAYFISSKWHANPSQSADPDHQAAAGGKPSKPQKGWFNELMLYGLLAFLTQFI